MAGLLPNKRREHDLADEIESHLQLHIDENLLRGMTREDARREAIMRLGGVESTKQIYRERRTVPVIENMFQDFRFALRQLRKNPGFTITAVFVLALGMSASVANFAFVDAALIKPLPYRDQSRLIGVFESSPGYPRGNVSYQDFKVWELRNRVFSSIAGYAMNGSFTLTTANGAEQVPGTRVSSGFFHTLGVVPILGRDFLASEDSNADTRSVILNYSVWQKRFAGKQDVIGRHFTLNGYPTTIVGVLPRGFQFPLYGGAEFWGNLRGSDSCERSSSCRNLNTIARLKDGVSIEAASTEMQGIAAQLQKENPKDNGDINGAALIPLRDLIVGDVRPVLLMLLVGAALLLLIACVNVSALLLARSDKRRREFAVRGALGASSWRLFSQFGIEGLLLAALGGSLGLTTAQWGMRFLGSVIPPDKMESMPYLGGLRLDPLTSAFGCAISIVAALLFAVIPIAGTNAIDGLKEGTRGSAGTTWRRLGSNLVVIEVAIAMVLMVGAGLLGKSLYLLLHVDVGFTPDHLAAMQTSWSPTKYRDDPPLIALEHQFIERVSMVPGVKSVALTTAPPIDSNWGTASFHIAGRENHGESNEVINRQISSGYFTTLEARLLRGRYFRDDEDLTKPLIAIVNRTLAKKFFGGEDPVGKQIYYDWQPRSPDMEIVGVVDDVKEGPLEGANMPVLYVPITQSPVGWPCILIRTAQPEAILYPQIAAAIHGIDPFITISEGQTLTERINRSPAAYLHRSAAFLVGLFAGTALLLSVVGLYGVVAYSVSQRTREIGIRMALGAQKAAMYRLILKEAGWLIGAGVVIGFTFSLGAATLMRGLLFGVRSWDAGTLIAVAAVLAFCALLASYVPARRAASVSPMEALHTE